jgi:hypothetical protein
MKDPDRLDLDEAQLRALEERLASRCLEPEDYEQLAVLVETVRYLGRVVQQKSTSIQRLLRLIFGARTEKTRTVLPPTPPEPPEPPEPSLVQPDGDKRPKRPGHGRRSAAEYFGAERVDVSHAHLKAGDRCPDCQNGRLHDTHRPSTLLRLRAQPPIAASRFDLQTLRCGTCRKVFTPAAPVEAGLEKYDPNVAPMLAFLRYGCGLPMNRIEQMQRDYGIPLPAGTQWGLLVVYVGEIAPIWPEFIRQAADGEVLCNDDTVARILSIEKLIRQEQSQPQAYPKARTGIFTTGILSTRQGRTISLFFSGRQHAGENLQKVLDVRDPALPIPIQMCDGLSRNQPTTAETILANCNAHGRREFVDVAHAFPEPCTYVLETFQTLYKHEAQAQAERMNPEQRLAFHQKHSGPLMEKLHTWMEQAMAEKQVEPNSGLGSAIQYMLTRWERLTLFLRVPGAPLDNNGVERSLKLAIRHRNNSLFYKTENGAHVGDLFMSLIHTCRLCGANAFDYLCALRRYAKNLRENPSAWMPWNYRETVAALAGG